MARNKKIELKKSPVLFNPKDHTYTLNDRQLSGITSIIHRYIFPDMYSGVSQSVLNKAAERGSRIHDIISMWFAGVVSDKDVEDIKPFVDATKDINFVASEYLVSDEDIVASSIDLVAYDKGYVLYDVKTTSVLNIEYLQWQLSIYAYLFEKQNNTKVLRLGAIHLRDGKCAICDIDRLPDEYVESLLNAYRNDAETFDNPLHVIPEGLEALLAEYASLEGELADIDAVRKPVEERQKEVKERIADTMKELKMKKLDTETVKVNIGEESTRESFDLKSFKETELYKQYDLSDFIKKTKVAGRITITLK